MHNERRTPVNAKLKKIEKLLKERFPEVVSHLSDDDKKITMHTYADAPARREAAAYREFDRLMHQALPNGYIVRHDQVLINRAIRAWQRRYPGLVAKATVRQRKGGATIYLWHVTIADRLLDTYVYDGKTDKLRRFVKHSDED